jgi:hypothetical protein
MVAPLVDCWLAWWEMLGEAGTKDLLVTLQALGTVLSSGHPTGSNYLTSTTSAGAPEKVWKVSMANGELVTDATLGGPVFGRNYIHRTFGTIDRYARIHLA